MPEPADDHADPCGPLDVADAWRNAQALATLLITFAVVASVALLVAASAAPVAYPIGMILCIVLAALGLSAAGSQFVEQAAGRPALSVARAFAATPRIASGSLLLVGALAAAFAVFVLVAAALLYAGRLPAVGPILLLLVVPALTIVGAALLMALAFAALLTLPALWEGHSLRTALSQLCAIAAQRHRRAVGELILPLLVAGALAVVGCVFVLGAFALVAALATALSDTIRLDDVAAGLAAGPSLAGGAPAIAAWTGVAMLATILGALCGAVFLFALAIGYRRCADGIDIAIARAAVARAIIELQVRKAETVEAIAPFVRRIFGSTAPTVRHGIACPHCASSAQPDDVYCGNCGQRLSAPLVT